MCFQIFQLLFICVLYRGTLKAINCSFRSTRHWISAVTGKHGRKLKWHWIKRKVNKSLNQKTSPNLVKITGVWVEELPYLKKKKLVNITHLRQVSANKWILQLSDVKVWWFAVWTRDGFKILMLSTLSHSSCNISKYYRIIHTFPIEKLKCRIKQVGGKV